MSHGANEYIIKPIREVELTSRIGLLLNRNNLFSSEFKPGAVFAERYKILALLGKGGDSTVYHALDTGSVPEREVALKILKIKEDPEIFASLIDRETHGLAQLDHPNIVKLLDHGNFKGTFYLATEFIKGRSLGEIIKESPLVEESAVDLALEVAEALQYISRFGIVHRDIKPDNILISDIGEVVIVDFGLAREAHQQTVAIRGEMFGTPQYLAPEYINGKDVDIKTDIYSLGITLFYMVSGILPFRAGTPMAFLHKQLNEAPPLLNEIAGGISKEFAELIDSMLIKNPTDRISLDQMIASFKKLQARHKAATPA
jgi:serine/threonine-protein kinase